VFATDLYAGGGSWTADAPPLMLTDPAAAAPAGVPFDPRRLVVQHMDGRNLHHPDESFDGLFSCGSIEHFGGREDVARAAAEMARVTKPGGIVTLATEFRVDGPPGLGFEGTVLFTPEMVEDWIVRPSGLRPVDPIDFRVSPRTVSHAYPLREAVQQGIRQVSIALTAEGYTYTSIFLALRKE
jgi:SAM-dependent methyltransferase